MKRKIFIGFVILSICIVAGGLYITRSIDAVISKLETIITLHQVETLREELLTDVKTVQQDLLLKDSPHATEMDSFVANAERMVDQVDSCFDCHHNGRTVGRLQGLQREILMYQEAMSRVYTTRANEERLSREKQIAFHIGQQIVREIESIIESSSNALAERTQIATNSIAETKRILTLLVVAGPALALAIGLYFIRGFTGSVETLITATRKLKAGDLEHRTEGLRDEFGELGESFNEMALALREMIWQIEENQKRYRMLFERAGDAILMLEADGENAGKIVSANQAAADMYGYSVEELMRLEIHDLDAPESAARSADCIQRILRGEWISEEITHCKRDGTAFSVAMSGGLLEFEDQKYILAFNKDITERKQAEVALQRAEQLMVFGEMAAGLAHEIKNPLAGIKLSIEVLSAELELEPDDSEVFGRIVAEINRIETLLKNLLSYATPPAPQFASVDVNRIIEAALKTAAFSLKSPSQKTVSRARKDIRFVRKLSDDLPPIIADPAQLQQVILNLLINAVHAIEESGRISVETSIGDGGFMEIVVSDTGKGFDGPDIEKIFMPFYTTKPKGTGLGLSICKRLVEQQHGRIEVARNSEGGLMFTIQLPIEQATGGRSA